jgi:hypothetical protein
LSTFILKYRAINTITVKRKHVFKAHPDWPNIHPRKIQEKMRADILKNPKNLSNLLYYGWDFLAKKWRGQEWSFTTDAFGPISGSEHNHIPY